MSLLFCSQIAKNTYAMSSVKSGIGGGKSTTLFVAVATGASKMLGDLRCSTMQQGASAFDNARGRALAMRWRVRALAMQTLRWVQVSLLKGAHQGSALAWDRSGSISSVIGTYLNLGSNYRDK